MSNNFRVEEKYYINQTTYATLLSRLNPLMQRDPHANYLGEYRIDSLYFDDYRNTSYYEKMDGISNRQKYRIRCYDLDESSLRLEKKIRKGSFIRKEIEVMEVAAYRDILSGTLCEFGKSQLLTKLAMDQRMKLLKPKLIVTYDREAFTFGRSNIRITFDKNLRLRIDERDLFESIDKEIYIFKDDKMILEVKYDGYLPKHIKDILQTNQHERYSISKYAICMAYRAQLLI